MAKYVAVYVPNITTFNAWFAGFLSSSTDPESEFFLDVQISEQERIKERISSGEKSLEYGPATPDVLSAFIRFSGDGRSKFSTLEELDRSMEAEYRLIDIDQSEKLGLHPVVVQAIEEQVVTQVRIYRIRGDRHLYLVCESEWA